MTRTQRARREDIVLAAVAVLDRHGYAAASIDRIATEADTSKSTVLYHFKSKEAVHQAVITELYRLGRDYMVERILAAESPRDRLLAYLRSNLRFIVEYAPHVRAVHRILENSDLRVDGAEAIPPLQHLLVTGQEAGDFGPFDAEVVALTIRAVIDGAAFHFTTHPDLDLDHYIEQAVALFDRATAPSNS